MGLRAGSAGAFRGRARNSATQQNEGKDHVIPPKSTDLELLVRRGRQRAGTLSIDSVIDRHSKLVIQLYVN